VPDLFRSKLRVDVVICTKEHISGEIDDIHSRGSHTNDGEEASTNGVVVTFEVFLVCLLVPACGVEVYFGFKDVHFLQQF
jgi:hypothetical protein